MICDVLNWNMDYGRKLQRVKMVEGYNRVKIYPSSETGKLDMCVVSYNKKVGKKLQRVKTVQRYKRVKISPSSEEDSLNISGWYHK